MIFAGEFIGWLQYQLGLRTDSASTTGSAHAKLKSLIESAGDSADVRADNTLYGWLATQIKSIQRGTITISSAVTSNTATITAVTMAKSIVVSGGFTVDDTYAAGPEEYMVRLVLTNTTTVTASKGVSGTGITIAYQVIEFY